MKPRLITAAAALLVTFPMHGDSRPPGPLNGSKLTILQPIGGAMIVVPQEVLTRQDGSQWFRLGPFVRGEPLVMEYEAGAISRKLARTMPTDRAGM